MIYTQRWIIHTQDRIIEHSNTLWHNRKFAYEYIIDWHTSYTWSATFDRFCNLWPHIFLSFSAAKQAVSSTVIEARILTGSWQGLLLKALRCLSCVYPLADCESARLPACMQHSGISLDLVNKPRHPFHIWKIMVSLVCIEHTSIGRGVTHGCMHKLEVIASLHAGSLRDSETARQRGS